MNKQRGRGLQRKKEKMKKDKQGNSRIDKD
jgi:hypothetical protein